MKCDCGALNPENAQYCQGCGNTLNKKDAKHYLILTGKTVLATIMGLFIGGILAIFFVGPLFVLFFGGYS